MNAITETQVRLIASSQSWIEGEAVRQLYAAADRDGVRLRLGFPIFIRAKAVRWARRSLPRV